MDTLRYLLEQGDERIDRTGVGTRATFGVTMRFNLQQAFPAFTSKRVYWKTAIKEILWMLNGGRNVRELIEQNVHIWSDWPHKKFVDATGEQITMAEFEQRVLDDKAFAEKWGDLGPVYGFQWRHWPTADGGEVDQVQQVIDTLKNNPTSRRLIFEGWNVAQLDEMALPPCHKTYQFYVANGKLSLALYQRSADILLGVPFNIVNGALLTHIFAQQCGLEVGEFVWFGVDVHLYQNHVDQAELQLSRELKELPQLNIKRKADSLFDYSIDDFELDGYDPHPPISAAVAV
jgi:thymidylate synthase